MADSHFAGAFFVFIPEPKTSKISTDHLETARVWHRIPDGWGHLVAKFVGLQFLHVGIAVYKSEPSDVHTYHWSKQRQLHYYIDYILYMYTYYIHLYILQYININ